MYKKTHPIRTITNAQIVFEYLSPLFNDFVEEFWIILVNHQLELIAHELVAKGTLNYCKVHMRDIFRVAVKHNAFAIILAHNHVSENVKPSEEDIKFTKRIIQISKIIEMPIFDHIIINKKEYFSFRDSKLLFR